MDVVERERGRYHSSASGLTVVAHFFGILATILMLVWLLHYREGLDLDSDDARRVFNVRPRPLLRHSQSHIHVCFPLMFVCAGSSFPHVLWVHIHGW